MAATLEINDVLFDQIDKELAGLVMTSRMPAIKKAMRTGGNVTKTRYVDYLPRSDDRKEGEHLEDTVAVKVIEYPDGANVLIVGANYAVAAHAHLLEDGFRIVVGGTAGDNIGKGRKTPRKSKRTGERGGGTTIGYVEGQHYLEAAVNDTESERDAAMLGGMTKAVEEAKKSG